METRYWLATWNWDSWLVFQGLEPQTIGFPIRPDISIGDVFVSYVKGDRGLPGQWVSADRVTGPYSVDTQQHFADGIWPHRWPVKPITPRYVAGDGVVAKDLIGGMDMFRGMSPTNWGSPLRTQGREVPPADGRMLVQLLSEGVAADPSTTGAHLLAERESNTRTPRRTSRSVPLGLRYAILKRDRFRCVKCGRSPSSIPGLELHIDHIVPWSKGGESIAENLQTMCSDCNLGKSNRDD